MSETLPVHVNREELHSLEVPASFETGGSFSVDLHNHGEAVHVHLHLDDALSEVASIDAANHYVKAHSTRSVPVTVYGQPPVHGKLKVVTAYGAHTRYVDVEFEEVQQENTGVRVDESLSTPRARTEEPASPLERPEVPVLVLGGLALVVAAVAALVVESTAVLLGALAVLGGVLLATYFLLQ